MRKVDFLDAISEKGTASASWNSYADREPILSAMVFAEARDRLIVGDERACKLDRGCDEKPIRRIATLEMMELIAAGSRAMAEGHCLDAWSFKKARNPVLDRNIQFDPPRIQEQRNLPDSNCTHKNGCAALPAIVDQHAR